MEMKNAGVLIGHRMGFAPPLQWGVIILFAFLWILICIIRWLLEKLISWILFVQSEISQQLTQTSVFHAWLFWGSSVRSSADRLSGGTHPPTPSAEKKLVGQLVKVLPRLGAGTTDSYHPLPQHCLLKKRMKHTFFFFSLARSKLFMKTNIATVQTLDTKPAL